MKPRKVNTSPIYTVKNSGIMFKPEMILAYLADRKNQTRRTRGLDEINKNPDDWDLIFTPMEAGTRFVSFGHKKDLSRILHINMPHGGIGDTLYFKETWKMWERDKDGKDFLHYRSDDAKVDPTWWDEKEWTRPDPVWGGRFDKWQPSMFMPRICSRFRNVPILNVRVERLHDITEEEAQLEGWDGTIENDKTGFFKSRSLGHTLLNHAPKIWYFNLWDEINGKTLPASKNPWLWVYEFPVCSHA